MVFHKCCINLCTEVINYGIFITFASIIKLWKIVCCLKDNQCHHIPCAYQSISNSRQSCDDDDDLEHVLSAVYEVCCIIVVLFIALSVFRIFIMHC